MTFDELLSVVDLEWTDVDLIFGNKSLPYDLTEDNDFDIDRIVGSWNTRDDDLGMIDVYLDLDGYHQYLECYKGIDFDQFGRRVK